MNAPGDDPESRVAMVLTLPLWLPPGKLAGVPHRTTLGALVDLTAQASCELILAAPFMQSGSGLLGHSSVYEAVKAALSRGVAVHIFSLERNLRSDDVALLRTERAAPLRLYCPASVATEQSWTGSHAKICIADARRAYVGSANLTRAGLSENVEVGLLVEGAVAEQLRTTWVLLLESGVFTQVT